MPRADGTMLPLTAAQTSVWTAHQLDPDNSIYHLGGCVAIRGALRVDVFAAALDRLVSDAELTRARVVADGGTPGQVVAETPQWTLEHRDTSAEADPHAAALAWMRTDLDTAVDPMTGPLFRHVLFRVRDDLFLWYQRGHHLVMDGYSGPLMTRRVAEVYTALDRGEPVPPNPFGPLTELVAADTAYRAAPEFAADRDYWAATLAGAPEPVSMSGRRMTTARGLHVANATLPHDVTERLRDLGRAVGVPLPILMVTGVAVPLLRATGGPDLVVGIPVTARTTRATRMVPGMVSNILPLRLSVRRDDSVAEVMATTSAALRAAVRHQRYPYDDMRRDLALLGDDRQLFGPHANIMLAGERLRFGDLPAVIHNLRMGPVDDISFSFHDQADDDLIGVDVEANRDLYAHDQVCAHASQITDVLAALAGADPAARIDTIAPRTGTTTEPYVLDRFLASVPDGVAGDVYRPDDTPAAVKDPFVGGRMAGTDEVARRRPDGTLELVRAAGDRTTLRGREIDLRAVDVALGVPGGAVVCADELVVVVAEPVPDLSSRLPRGLRPDRVIVAAVLPVTEDGRFDRAAAEALAAAAPADELVEEGGGPASPHEEIVRGLVAEVLGRPDVDPDDGFFDLGGHSLSAVRLLAKIHEVLGVRLGIRDVFEARTVRRIAVLAAGTDRAVPETESSVERTADVSLSPAQRRMWFLNRFERANVAYNMPFVLRLTGPLDRAALRRALGDLVARHETLRTVYPEDAGAASPELRPATDPDLSVVPTDEAGLVGALVAAARHEFDLTTDLPVVPTLFELGPRDHVLLVLVHHIAGDGGSVVPLVRDLTTAYAARVTGAAPDLPALRLQYADHAARHDGRLGDDHDPDSVLYGQLAHWRSTLDALPPELSLPADRPRPERASYAGDWVRFALPDELHAGIADLARAHHVTVFMVVQAALAAVLTRAGAGVDIPIGTPVAGRGDAALDDLVGFFVNTLVLRTDTAGDPTFAELLARVRETDLAAFAHQDMPFERLVEDLNPPRSPARHPLFQVMLAFQHDTVPEFDVAGLHVAPGPSAPGVAKFDLTVRVAEEHTVSGAPAGITGAFEFAVDLFDPPTVARLVDAFTAFLAEVVADPHTRVGGAPPEWSLGGPLDVPDVTIPELFRDVVARVAADPAVTADGETLSYARLDARANQLARLLTARGVGQETRVVVLLPRSVDLVVALLGVLKAGGAYVPVDPSAPESRLRAVVADSGAALVVTGQERAEPGALVLTLDDPALAEQSEVDLEPVAAPDNAAYVIYTSGSTGTPKGVVVAHRSVVSYLVRTRAAYGAAVTGTALLSTPVTFDLSVTALYTPLVSGGTVRLGDLEDEVGPRPVFTKLTPSHLPLLATLPDDASPSHTLVLGGERLLGEQVAGWRARNPDAVVVNAYGPTEATVNCAEHVIAPHTPLPPGPVPIGRPFAGSRLYVLDERLRPAPVGVPGELYAAGACLARGYLGRPDLTAERFVACQDGGRMYRTGDLVKWRPDGTLEFVGRVDDQVKVRGHRVEPGEIESVLLRHPSVTACVVTVREDEVGDQRIVAYVVADGAVPDGRSFVARHLPGHLVPSAVVALDALPLTAHGKVDRAALPAPEWTSGEEFAAPRSPSEEILCRVFEDVLGVPSVGVRDDFFSLGGHSLLATRVVSRVRAVLGAELAVRDLFEVPTVAGLVSRLGSASTRKPLTPAPRSDRMPLSFAQRRLWFLNRLGGSEAAYNIRFAVRLTGRVDLAALTGALADVVARHESLRTVFPEVDGEPVPHLLPPADAAPELVASRVAEHELATTLSEVAAAGFDLTTSPPLRAHLFELAQDEHVFFVVVHHIAADGWSLAPIAGQFSDAYAARRRGTTHQWQELPVRYADYAVWQRETLGDESEPDSPIARQLAYWRSTLAGAPPELALPLDFPRPHKPSHLGDVVQVDVPSATHAAVVALARDHQVTVFMVVQAAFAVLLSRLGAGTDIPIGTPIAGRTDQALDDLVGFFVNTLVLRTDLSGDPTFAELLARVRETDLAAYAHQDAPFERVVDVVNPERSLSRHPLFQVMLAFQNNAEAELSLPDLVVTPVTEVGASAKFDLTVNVAETFTDGVPAGLRGGIEYATELFARTSVEAIAARLNQVLATVVAAPEHRVGDVDVLLPGERDRLATATSLVLDSELRLVPPGVVGDRHVLDPRGERRLADGAAVTPTGERARHNHDGDVETVRDGQAITPTAAPTAPPETVALLSEIFADVLGVPMVGPDADFFAMGGHSLLATKLMSRVRKAVDTDLSVWEFFEHPTVAGLAGKLAGVSVDRPEPAVPDRPARPPLSFAQQRLWFLDRFEQSGSLYNTASTARLRGPLDIDALRLALRDVVDRHEVLRTVIREEADEPYQHVLAAAEPPVTVRPVAEAEVGAGIAGAVAEPFDLAEDLPLRVLLLAVAPDDHVLVLVVHHIAADGWSMAPLARDLSTAYAARLAGDSPEWTPLPVRYADHAVRQRADTTIGEQVEHWRTVLAGLPAEMPLPHDFPRPATPSRAGGSVPLVVPTEIHDRVRELARTHQVTVFTVVHAALAALLARIGAGNDIPVGTPVAGRDDPAVADLVGLFVNTVVLRTDTGGDPTFTELLTRVRAADLDAFAHQHVPFERLVEELTPARSLSRHPLFQVVLSFENNEPVVLDLPGLDVSAVPEVAGEARFDLTVAIGESTAGLTGELRYATDLFTQDTVALLADRFVLLLASVVADPAIRLGDLDLAGPAEDVLATVNDTASDLPEAGLPELFAAQASRTPDAIALVFDDERLTYQQLDERANQLAHRLLALGVTRGTVVGVHLERSPEFVVALLAVLKAGCAYLALDPDFPAARRAAAVEAADVPLVITRSAHGDTPALLVGDHSGGPTHAPDVQVGPDDLACVMFTSGSTGAPKGIATPHRALVGTFLAQDYVHFGPDEVFLQSSPVSWDACALELFGALLHGGTCVLQPGQRPEPAAIADLVTRHGVTMLQMSASLFNYVLDEHPEVFGRLRCAMTAGEAASARHVATALRDHPGVRLVNGYGPAESMGLTTSHPITAVDRRAGGVPIGRPVTNKRTYLLDERLRPVPVGVVGELYVAGAGLARGYVGGPDLTAERFVACHDGGRMYRTGDLARWTAAGHLEFVARADDQVKVRGFRVEPGEVAAAVLRHPAVSRCVVTVRTDTGDPRLVAYVVADDGFTAGECRAFVADALPDHLVPAAFVVLDEIPMTPNGKLDRAALPAPGPAGEDDHAAPGSVWEATLCAVFADVLGVPRVGVHDDFFALGGHSLLATRAVSRVRVALGVELAVRDLFEAPTVAGLAGRARRARASRAALGPRPRGAVVPMSFAQQRLWIVDRLDGGRPAYNVPLVVRLRGPLDRAALGAALSDVVARHESLRTVFLEVDGLPAQQVLDPAPVPLPVVDCVEADLPELVTERAHCSFDLGADLPLRAWLLALSPQDHVFVLVVHHIAGDGWSMAPLVRDVSTAYRARLAGTSPEWPPLPVRYADFAVWQRELVGDEADPSSLAATQLDFWRATLAGVPEELALPFDHRRPASPSFRGDVVRVAVPADVHAGLVAVARRHHVTVFMVVRAAFAVLLSRLGAGVDIPIGTPVAGRTDEALDELVGFFVNTLVLRTDLAGDPTFTELLARVRETDLAAHANQDVPFERVVEAIDPVRSLARHPLFQVMFAFQNTAQETPDLPGLTASAQNLPGGTAKFDLTVGLAEEFGAAGAPAGIGGVLEYATDLFTRATAEAMAEQFLRVLTGVVADQDQRVTRLDVLGPAERHRLLVELNDTARDLPETTLTEMLAAQVASTPDGVALVDGDTELTYRELDRRADRLARHLAAAGAAPERLVAVAIPRSVDMFVAIVATLKAGAAFMPLDLDQPEERVAFLLDDAAPALVATTAAHADRVAAGAPVVVVDDLPDTDPPAPAPDVRLTHPAYVIYTSGSTGQPKGVLVPHTGIAGLAATHVGALGLDRTSRVYQAVSPTFDAFVADLVQALTSGAALVLAPPRLRLAGHELAARLTDQRITHLMLPPPVLGLLSAAEVPTVRRVATGGEACPPEIVADWANHGRPLLNAYGPTEATVTVSITEPLRAGEPVHIGRPTANTRLYVLDATLSPAPVGVVGELHIAGKGLARGYLNRPADTAERFVACPFGGRGERMYRTGDLARWRRDGHLEFVGRADDQVKVRGFRIELGEIEAVLARQPAVRQAAVIVREDAPGARRIVAYVVGETEGLRVALSEVLPDYLVPSAFVPLPALPVTANGKLDRAALPAPVLPSRGAPPRTEREEVLRDLFCDVLGLPDVGVDEAFFDLGGDSIVAIQLVSRARKAGLVLTPKDVFTHRTVAALAAAARDEDTVTEEEPEAGTGPVPLTPIMHWLRELGGPVDRFSQSLLVRTPAGLDVGGLVDAVRTLLDRHDMLRATLDEDWELVVRPRGAVESADCVSRVDIAGLTEAEVMERVRAASEEATGALAPRRGRLLRVVWFDAGEDRGRLLVVVHHLVVDGVSWRILVPELAELWTGARAEPYRPGTSFRRWATGLVAAAHDPARVAELPRWQEIVGGEVLRLTDRPLDPARDTVATVRSVRAELTPDQTRPLLTTVPAAVNATVADVLMTALSLALAGRARRRGGPHAVLVDVEGHGRDERTRVDLTRTVGWFTTMYPVRLDPGVVDWAGVAAGGPVLGAVLKRVKEQVRAVPDDGYGLLRHLNDDTRDVLAAAAPAQVGFNYLGRFAVTDGQAAMGDWAELPDREALAPGVDPAMPLAHVLEITVSTRDHPDGPRLAATWAWAGALLTEEDVQELVVEWIRLLGAVAGQATGGLTPSDVGLLALSQDEIADFEADFEH
jgi:amino acid adenylation domain-containing protein/non-ribosomal peptide synthase protein (TIGR01720 family)